MPVETPTTEEGSEIKHQQMANLERPMMEAFKEVLPNLERGDYDLIIGIDASGRIPTLIMDKLINYIYTKNGHDSLKTRFLAGARNASSKKENVEDKIREWNPQKKVLIVEDIAFTCSSIKHIADCLKDMNIHFDIMAVQGPPLDGCEGIGADNIYSSSQYSSIYGARHLSGVEKDAGHTFSKATEDRKSVREARADADIIVSDLINWYEFWKQETSERDRRPVK